MQGNLIGTDVAGTAGLGNSGAGVAIHDASSSRIGGTTPGAGNTIAFNDGHGVIITLGERNAILSNSMLSNTGLGIDLGGDGVTPNDPADTDVGPNSLLNFPDIASATPGRVEGTACVGCTVEIFRSDSDPSGHGEGMTFAASGVADASGRFSILVSGLDLGDLVTATATDGQGNTSEFSANIEMVALPDTDGDGCTDTEELGPDETLGGRRDYLNPHDFFDVPLPPGPPDTGSENQVINIFDALGVLAKFGTHDNGTPEDFGDDPPNFSGQVYNPDFDRTLKGPEAWQSGPPDGVIDIDDLIRALAQFGHSCLGPP